MVVQVGFQDIEGGSERNHWSCAQRSPPLVPLQSIMEPNEYMNVHQLSSLAEARSIIDSDTGGYNHQHPQG